MSSHGLGLDLERALTGLHELLVMSLTMLQRHDVDGVIDVLARGVCLLYTSDAADE